MFQKDYYEYNEGEIISNKTERLEIRNTNDELKTTLPLNLSTITGKLNGEGESVTIFPDGMRSAGTAYDSLIVDEDGYARKAIKAIGEVDLGTLNWVKNASTSAYKQFFSAVLTGIKNISTWVKVINVICVKYIVENGNAISIASGKNNFICGQPNTNNIRVNDDSYTDVATFKAAMSGVELIYELATPLEYTLDNPIKLTFTNYHNSKFVQIPSPPASAPITVNYRKLGGG